MIINNTSSEFICNIQIHEWIVIGWIIISFAIWLLLKHCFTKKLELRYKRRIMIYYFIFSFFFILLGVGDKFVFLEPYLASLIAGHFGIGFSVLIIDGIISFTEKEQKKLYRELALRNSKMPIYTYFFIWKNIYESTSIVKPITDFENLKSFFNSDDFYSAITNYDFNKLIAPDKSYGKYYNEKVLNVSDKFQNILSKYASKLDINDLKLLEHFGGNAYFYKVFAVNKFMTEVQFTISTTTPGGSTTTKTTRPFVNSFKDLTKTNFQKHFHKLLELIDNYNKVIGNDYDEWNLNSLTNLETISAINDNERVQW